MQNEKQKENNQLAHNIYEYSRNKYSQIVRGSGSRKIKNWDKIEEKSEWVYYQRFAEMVNKSNGQIDYKLYIDALYDTFNGYFQPKLIGSQKSFAIYKTYIDKLNANLSEESAYAAIIKSIKYVINYCVQYNIETFDDYFYKNANTYPTIILHYNSGAISNQMFCLIPNISRRVNSFPIDIVNDYFPPMKKQQLLNDRIVLINCSQKIKYIADNFEVIVNNAIAKAKNN